MIASTLLCLSFGAVNAQDLTNTAPAADYQLGVAAQAGLFGGVPVVGLEALYNVNAYLSLGLDYQQGDRDFRDELASGSTMNIVEASAAVTQTRINVRYKMGPTFYMGAGLGQRTLDLKVEAASWYDGSASRAEVSSKVLVGNILIGNIWNLNDGWFIGCDWITFGKPVGSAENKVQSYTQLDSRSARVKAQDDEDLRSIADDAGSSTIGSLLTVRFGKQF